MHPTTKMKPKYVCLDIGGSKLECRVLDKKGKLLKVFNQNEEVDVVVLPGANFNMDGAQKVETALKRVFDEVQLGSSGQSLNEYLGKCQVVVGMAGVVMKDIHTQVVQIFNKIGVTNLDLQSDVEITLNSIPDKNAIAVITGTGHAIFGKKEGVTRTGNGGLFRLGGFGRSDDKPSGFYIGLEGIKAVRSFQYEEGPNTSLNDDFAKFFCESDARSVWIKADANKELTTAKVAEFARIVFGAATKGDLVAQAIVDKWFITSLKEQFMRFIDLQKMNKATVYFVGGLMKSDFADKAIASIQDALGPLAPNFILKNQANENPVVSYVLTKISEQN